MNPISERVESPSRPASHFPRVSREQEALRDLSSPIPSKTTRFILVLGFVSFLSTGLLSAWFYTQTQSDRTSKFFDFLPDKARLLGVRRIADLWALMPQPEALRRAEKSLEDQSPLVNQLRPRVQQFLTVQLGAGNEQVVPASDGWLFFRRDMDYVNGPPFLERSQQRARRLNAAVEPDPLAAILDFESQLRARGIQLLLIPVPVKPSIEGHRFSRHASIEHVRQNASYGEFLSKLRERGVHVFDPSLLLLERIWETGEAQYLRTDTHWTPSAMEAVASAAAREIRSHIGPVENDVLFEAGLASACAPGDTLALLGLPRDQKAFAPQQVTLHPVYNGTQLWKPQKDAEVLLLGDSFSNIYSLGAMGWGEGAGFAEHLSKQLSQPVDAILRNNDGAFATRQILQRELAAGRDRLAGKKWVVWEFAARELSFGDWKPLRLRVNEPAKPSFYHAASGQKVRVNGVVSGVSSVPRPGTVPYKEHIVCLHLVEVRPEDAPDAPAKECVVFTWSMREQALTEAGRLRLGDSVSLELQPWEDVSDNLERFQRSELDEPTLLLEPAHWSESVVPLRH